MGERTSYAPGTFSWAELVTSDGDAAKAFYTSVFGWEYEDHAVGDGQVYSMARRDGEYVAALYAGDPPPHWNSYVTVESADAAAARAGELGGAVLAEAFDVMDSGRMAVLADPQGAAIFVWQPKQHIGAGLVNVPGALTWNELVTPDADAAARFYGDLFGWEAEEIPEAQGYRVIRLGGRSNGGIMPRRPEQGDAPPTWGAYFGHEDVDRLIGEIDGFGGRLISGPMQLPNGRIAILQDPQGAIFAAWSGEFDD
jgi:uncharacterized protein